MEFNCTLQNINSQQFQDILNQLYPIKRSWLDEKNPIPIEYNEPYIDEKRYGKHPMYGKINFFDNHPAEIFHPDPDHIQKVRDLIKKIGLREKGYTLEGPADIMLSGGRRKGGIIQILFTNEPALQKFKEAVLKRFNEMQKSE